MTSGRFICVLATLGMVLGVSGHTDDEMAAHGSGPNATLETPESYPATYFTLDAHQLEIKAHISLMVLSWFIILPIGKPPSFHLIL